MSIEQLTQFFGWCSIINIAVLMLTSILIVGFKKPIAKIHSRIVGVPQSGLPYLYFQYLAAYKIGFFMFSLVPYIALKAIA